MELDSFFGAVMASGAGSSSSGGVMDSGALSSAIVPFNEPLPDNAAIKDHFEAIEKSLNALEYNDSHVQRYADIKQRQDPSSKLKTTLTPWKTTMRSQMKVIFSELFVLV